MRIKEGPWLNSVSDAVQAGSLSGDGLDDEVNRSLAIVAGSLLVQAYRIR